VNIEDSRSFLYRLQRRSGLAALMLDVGVNEKRNSMIHNKRRLEFKNSKSFLCFYDGFVGSPELIQRSRQFFARHAEEKRP